MNTAGIVQIGDPVLREPCIPVEGGLARVLFGAVGRRLEAAPFARGRIGVAAPQIGVNMRAFAARISQSHPRLFLNPELILEDGEQFGREGCLSIAERWFWVRRSEHVRVRAQDLAGEWFEVDAHGLDARALQHELDHLDGILVVDRVREQLASLPRQLRREHERQLAKVPA